MTAAPVPQNESERLHELYKLELLDTAYEAEFDEIVKLASQICNVPISLITLVDLDRQWFKARHGLDKAETDRNISFCGHAILADELFEVKDAISDDRFHDNPLVTGEPQIRYYAGMPLVTNGGYKIGTLCVIDRTPRNLDDEQLFALKVLSRQVMKLFELRIKNKELKNITEVQKRFMAILAHDIRGPLASLETTFELKNSGFLTNEEIKEFDELIPAKLDSAVQLLNNILDWGKIQTGESSGNWGAVNVHELWAECVVQLKHVVKQKNNVFVNSAPEDISVEADRLALEFIIRNLASNAYKFTSGGAITFSATKFDDRVEMSVKDEGVGMSKDAQDAILMRKEYYGTTPGTHNEKGSGLGLKLMYEYLLGIGGDLRFESTAGNGTTVTVVLPVEH